MTKLEDDPLAELLLDAKEVDRAVVARTLRDILGIDVESGRMVMKQGWTALSARHKVLAFLLGRKAAFLLGRSDAESVSPKEIVAETGMPQGTVAPKLKELFDGRVISRMEGGSYFISHHQVHDVADELRGAL